MNNQGFQNRSRSGNAPGGPGGAGPGNPSNPINNGARSSFTQYKQPPNQRKSPGVAIPYSPEEVHKIQRQLNRVLGPEYVSCRPGGGGQNVSYIEGWKALNLANEIFGFNGWSSELISVQVDYLDNHGSGRVSLGLSVVVRITIKDGTFHEDFGYGNIENAKNKAMAFEKCKKEAFTDALKRCLRCFGNVLGNCLYDRGIVAKMQKVKLPAFELEWDDFHRDPLFVKREQDKLKKSSQATNGHIQEATSGNSSSTNSLKRSELDTENEITSTTLGRSTGPSNQNPVSFGQNGAQNNQNKNSSQPGTGKGTLITPSMVRDLDLDDFDDSFEFSDDLPAEVSAKEPTTEEPPTEEPPTEEPPTEEPKDWETPAGGLPEAMPGKVFFTSSRKALEVQKESYKSETPVFDHTFVATSVKRTVDPYVSTKIKRTDIPVSLTASEMNSSHTGPTSAHTANIAINIGKRPLGMPPSQRPPAKRLYRPTVDNVESENVNGS